MPERQQRELPKPSELRQQRRQQRPAAAEPAKAPEPPTADRGRDLPVQPVSKTSWDDNLAMLRLYLSLPQGADLGDGRVKNVPEGSYPPTSTVTLRGERRYCRRSRGQHRLCVTHDFSVGAKIGKFLATQLRRWLQLAPRKKELLESLPGWDLEALRQVYGSTDMPFEEWQRMLGYCKTFYKKAGCNSSALLPLYQC